MIDSNKCIRTGVLTNRLREQDITKAISDRYFNISSLQPTYQVGVVPINSIFTSNNLVTEARRYLPFRLANFDYRTIQIRVKFNQLFRYSFQNTAILVYRRVQCQNLLVVEKFISLIFIHNDLYLRIFNIQSLIGKGIQNLQLPKEYEETHRIRMIGILLVDRQYRKLLQERYFEVELLNQPKTRFYYSLKYFLGKEECLLALG